MAEGGGLAVWVPAPAVCSLPSLSSGSLLARSHCRAGKGQRGRGWGSSGYAPCRRAAGQRLGWGLFALQEGTRALFALLSAAGRALGGSGRVCPSRAPAPVRGTPRGGTGAAPVAGSPGRDAPGWLGDAFGAEFPAPPSLRGDGRAAPLVPPRLSRGSPHPAGQTLGTAGSPVPLGTPPPTPPLRPPCR